MEQDPQTEPAWARYQASKSDAARERHTAFLRTLDRRPASRPVPYDPVQQARHDQLQGLLDACAVSEGKPVGSYAASALDWDFAPKSAAPASQLTPAKSGFEDWLTTSEKKALRPYFPLKQRRNAACGIEALDFALCSKATSVPISRMSERVQAVYVRTCKRGQFDLLAEAIDAGELDEALSPSRKDSIRRICTTAIREGRELRASEAKRKASSDSLVKSRRKSATAVI